MNRAWVALFCASLAGAAAVSEPTYTFVDYSELEGWAEDDHARALEVFTNTCADIPREDWKRLCAVAKDSPAARDFFETFFQPVLIEDGEPMLFTGYFEPELRGSRTPAPGFDHPIYRVPANLREGQTYLTRRQIEEGRSLAGQGLEIAWLTDPVDLFFLQVQGSGRIRLDDGSMIRVGYGAKNGHDYRSIGQALIARGVFQPHEVSADTIRTWVRNNPVDGQELLWLNPSYVFFREVSQVPANMGPLGAMNRSITPGRTIAVDPEITILGAPVWIEKAGSEPINRLMIAQDTGSAIKGAQRADIFYGTGRAAGAAAGNVRDPGRMVVLMPVEYALAKVSSQVE